MTITSFPVRGHSGRAPCPAFVASLVYVRAWEANLGSIFENRASRGGRTRFDPRRRHGTKGDRRFMKSQNRLTTPQFWPSLCAVLAVQKTTPASARRGVLRCVSHVRKYAEATRRQ